MRRSYGPCAAEKSAPDRRRQELVENGPSNAGEIQQFPSNFDEFQVPISA
jgi:hypothetical protein